MKIGRFDRLAFFVSATVLAFLYGYGASTLGWFPSALLDDALRQTAVYTAPPQYLAPRVHQGEGVTRTEPADMQPGVTLIASHFPEWDWTTGLRLIDAQGELLHEWSVNPDEIFAVERGGLLGTVRGVRPLKRRGVHGAYVFPDGDVLVSVEYIGLARLDACGNVRWSLENGAHHAVARAEDGTFWVPVAGPAELVTTEQYPDGHPGLDRPVNHDRLMRLSPEGSVLDSISMFDVLFANGLARYIVRSRPYLATDYLHLNDVEPLTEAMADEYPLFAPGDLLVSLRAPDLVMVVDPDTEVVKWHMSDPFVQQHDPDFIGGGWIGVLNNNWDWTQTGTMLGGSEILAVQPHTDSVAVLYEGSAAEPFYTAYLGKWQMLENGNLLVTEGRTGRIFEADSQGRTVWEWIHPPFDADRVVEVTEGTRLSLDRDTIDQWSCERAIS